jgi:hypothetical protein
MEVIMDKEKLNSLPIKINKQVVKVAEKINKLIEKLNNKDDLGRDGNFLRAMRVLRLAEAQQRVDLFRSDIALIDMKLTLEKYLETMEKDNE